MGLFFILYLALLSYITSAQLYEIRGRFERLLRQLGSQSLPQLNRAFTRLHRETLEAFRMLQHLNAQMVSPILLIFLFGNFSLNIYVVTLLTYRNAQIGGKLIFLFIIIIQAYSFTVITHLLTKLAKRSTCAHLLVYRLQMLSLFSVDKGGSLFLNYQLAKFKLKLNNFYECLNSRKPFRFTVGPLAHVSRANILQVKTF